MRRFFVKKIIDSEKIILEGSDYNHLKNVLRFKVGDEIICFCGDGKDYFCEIISLENQKVLCKIQKIQLSDKTPKSKVTLFQALLKSDKFEFIIQKMSELGLTSIIPFESTFTVSKLKEGKTLRYNKISIEASKQCGRADFLKVHDGITFNEMLEKLKGFEIVIFANENENNTSIKDVINNYDDTSHFLPLGDKCEGTLNSQIALIVGSEGGFSEKEIFEIISRGAKSVSLGKRILRAETASITLASIIMFLLGELNQSQDTNSFQL